MSVMMRISKQSFRGAGSIWAPVICSPRNTGSTDSIPYQIYTGPALRLERHFFEH